MYVGDKVFNEFRKKLEALCAEYGIIHIDATKRKHPHPKWGEIECEYVRVRFEDDTVREDSSLARVGWLGSSIREKFWTPDRFLRLVEVIPEERIMTHDEYMASSESFWPKKREWEENFGKTSKESNGRYTWSYDYGPIRQHFDLDRGHHQLNDLFSRLDRELGLQASEIREQEHKKRYPDSKQKYYPNRGDCLDCVNEGYLDRYQQPTAKQRVVAALKDICQLYPSWIEKDRIDYGPDDYEEDDDDDA